MTVQGNFDSTLFHQPLVSIIVPVYGIDRYIGLCIESLLQQTYKNIEVLLVDDGSPDRCPEICDLYASKDSRIKTVHKANGGLVSARKTGLTKSNGDYISCVDGDDYVEPDFIESLIREALSCNADMVCAGYSRDLFQKSVRFFNAFSPGIYQNECLKKLEENMLSYGRFYKPGISTYVWNKLFKRRLLLEPQMRVDCTISIGEDAAVTYPALMKCDVISLINNTSYHYRQREDSMLKQCDKFSLEIQKLRCLYHYLKLWESEFPAESVQKYHLHEQICDYVLSLCIIRSGGRLPGNEYSAFGNDYCDKNVVIYSAGTFGQQLVNRIKEYNICRIAGWIDDDYREYRRCCMDVDPVEKISEFSYDYILIATTDGSMAERICQRLEGYGVNRKKMLTVSAPENMNKKELLIEKFLDSSRMEKKPDDGKAVSHA